MAKAGRPKKYRPHEIKLQLPSHPLRYKAKRLYWALLEMEKRMTKDITSVKMTDYDRVLSSYIEVVEELKKQGITYGSKTKQRVDAQRLAESDTRPRTKAGVGEDGQTDLGVGVPAVNPIT